MAIFATLIGMAIRASFFILLFFCASALPGLNPIAKAAIRCDQAYSDNLFAKLGRTATAPARALYARAVYTEVPQFMDHPIYQAIEQKLPGKTAVAAKSLLSASSNAVRKVYNALGTEGLGLPLPHVKTREEVARAQKNLEFESSYERTYWSDLSGFFNRFSLVRNTKTISLKSYRAMILAATAFFAIHTAGNVAEAIQAKPVQVSYQTTMATVHPLKDSQVEILNETAPFPHTAIRIGDMVYSHGVSTLMATPIDLYMNSHRLKQEGAVNGSSGAKFLNDSLLKKFGELDRSVDSVVLNLDRETVLQLRNELMSEVNKDYKNKTFVNSCATMLVRVLSKQNVDISLPFLDASPSLLLSQLSLDSLAGRKNQSGQSLIDGIYRLNYANTPETSFRNLLIRQIEGGVQLQVYSLPYRLTERAIIEAKNPNLSDFYMNEQARNQAILEIRQNAEADLHMIQEYDLYHLEMQQLKESGASAKEISDLRNQYASVFSDYISQYKQELQNPGISFSDYYTLIFKLRFLADALRLE